MPVAALKGDLEKKKNTIQLVSTHTICDTHETRQSRLCVLTKQLSCLREPVFGLSPSFDLNSTLGVFSGDTGTIKEERGCTNTWMTPSKKNVLSCEQYDLTLHWNNVKSELLAGK